VTDHDTCQKHRDNFPLLLNRTLSEQERAELVAHLRECGECRRLFDEEVALYAVAGDQRSSNPLQEHPTVARLTAFADEPHQLADAVKTEIAAHIDSCELCADLVNRLKSLPFHMDDIITPGEAPLINRLDSVAHPDGAVPRKISLVRSRVVRWAAALATATVAVIATIFIATEQPGQPAASWAFVTDAALPGTVSLTEMRRADSQPPAVGQVDDHVTVTMAFDAFPDEETYRLSLVRDEQQILVREIGTEDFLAPGVLQLQIHTAELMAGPYDLRLEISDLNGRRRSTAIYRFELSK
jgi:hypothetical protein